jgi:aerobic-type carbon monoxide dehydrogenase small subunit (CoxS/CutS family)
MVSVVINVNGRDRPVQIEPDRSLLSVVREEIGLTGSKAGCDDSECGACMMLLDGQPVNSCSFLAVQADGRQVRTVESLAEGEELGKLQEAMLERGGVQCGFCTPGVLDRNPHHSAEEVRAALSGNLCRCTGYQGMVEAVLDTAAARSAD